MNQPAICIAGRTIGEGYAPYVIAEMSGNHNGDLGRALRLMEAAKAAGADAVKLQTYTADTITIDHDGPGFMIEGGLWHGRKLYDLYQEASTPWKWHETLFRRAAEISIHCFSSPFDESAVDLLERLGAPAYKIASFEIVDLALIRRAAATGKPLIISTGMANTSEIDEALAAGRNAAGVALLHCVSGYPTPVEQANLGRIKSLAARYECPIGLSDHTLGTDVAVAAVALGACIVEKHVTLARADGGPDAAFSLEPDELARLVHGARTAFSAMQPTEPGPDSCEEANRIFRRSLYAVADIKKGEMLTEANVRSIRPGFGLPPKHLPDILGRRAKHDIVRGTPMRLDMIQSS